MLGLRPFAQAERPFAQAEETDHRPPGSRAIRRERTRPRRRAGARWKKFLRCAKFSGARHVPRRSPSRSIQVMITRIGCCARTRAVRWSSVGSSGGPDQLRLPRENRTNPRHASNAPRLRSRKPNEPKRDGRLSQMPRRLSPNRTNPRKNRCLSWIRVPARSPTERTQASHSSGLRPRARPRLTTLRTRSPQPTTMRIEHPPVVAIRIRPATSWRARKAGRAITRAGLRAA